MELQTKSLDITTSVWEKINISVERAKRSILAIQMNTNKEQTEEEVVITRTKQLEKEIKKGKTIYTKVAKKEVDKPSQFGEF